MKAAIHFIAIPDLISFVKILKYNLGIPLKTGKKIAEVGFLYFGSFSTCEDPDLEIDEKSKQEIKDFLNVLDKSNICFSAYWCKAPNKKSKINLKK